MLYLNVQDAPVAEALGVDYTLIDYQGVLYPARPRVVFLPGTLLRYRSGPSLVRGYHFDLNSHSGVLEQLLWSGWRETFTVSGRYRATCFPLSQETVQGFDRVHRGIATVGATVEPYPNSVWAWDFHQWLQGLWAHTRWYAWQETEPPQWATHTWRSYLTRKWRISPLRAVGEEQVRLRQVWHDLLGHKTPA